MIDLVPEPYRNALSVLQSGVPPKPAEQVRHSRSTISGGEDATKRRMHHPRCEPVALLRARRRSIRSLPTTSGVLFPNSSPHSKIHL